MNSVAAVTAAIGLSRAALRRDGDWRYLDVHLLGRRAGLAPGHQNNPRSSRGNATTPLFVVAQRLSCDFASAVIDVISSRDIIERLGSINRDS